VPWQAAIAADAVATKKKAAAIVDQNLIAFPKKSPNEI
jgi:hypothetical protein